MVECSGGHPEWHIQDDALQVIKRKGGVTQSGNLVLVDKWHLMVAHPPCTYLTSSGAKWYYHPEDKHLPIEQRRHIQSSQIARKTKKMVQTSLWL